MNRGPEVPFQLSEPLVKVGTQSHRVMRTIDCSTSGRSADVGIKHVHNAPDILSGLALRFCQFLIPRGKRVR